MHAQYMQLSANECVKISTATVNRENNKDKI